MGEFFWLAVGVAMFLNYKDFNPIPHGLQNDVIIRAGANKTLSR